MVQGVAADAVAVVGDHLAGEPGGVPDVGDGVQPAGTGLVDMQDIAGVDFLGPGHHEFADGVELQGLVLQVQLGAALGLGAHILGQLAENIHGLLAVAGSHGAHELGLQVDGPVEHGGIALVEGLPGRRFRDWGQQGHGQKARQSGIAQLGIREGGVKRPEEVAAIGGIGDVDVLVDGSQPVQAFLAKLRQNLFGHSIDHGGADHRAEDVKLAVGFRQPDQHIVAVQLILGGDEGIGRGLLHQLAAEGPEVEAGVQGPAQAIVEGFQIVKGRLYHCEIEMIAFGHGVQSGFQVKLHGISPSGGFDLLSLYHKSVDRVIIKINKKPL